MPRKCSATWTTAAPAAASRTRATAPASSRRCRTSFSQRVVQTGAWRRAADAGPVRGRHRVSADGCGRASQVQDRSSKRSSPRRASSWSAGGKVPTQTEKADIGPTAKAGEPHIEQLVIAAGKGLSGDAFERQLYLIRKQASHPLRGDASLAQAQDVLRLLAVDEGDHLQGDAHDRAALQVLSRTSPRRITPATWRWSTRGSRPTRSPRGTAPSRCGS